MINFKEAAKVNLTPENQVICSDYFCWILFSVVSGFYLVLPVYFYDVYSYSHTRASFVISVYLAGRAIGMLTYLRLIKRLISNSTFRTISTERLFLCISGFMTAILICLFVQTKNYYTVLGAMFLIGVVASSFTTLNTAIMNGNTSDKDQIKHSSLQRLFQNVGIIITFALFACWKKVHFDIFYVIAAIVFVAAILEMFLLNSKILPKHDAHSTAHESNTGSREKVRASRNFFIVLFLTFVIFMQIPNVYAYYLHDVHQIDSSFFSGLMVLNALLVIALQMPLSKFFIEKIGERLSTALGLLLIGLGVVLPIFHFSYTVYLSFCVWTIGEIFMFTGIKAYMISFSDKNSLNNVSLTTRYYTIFYLSSLACPLVIKLLYHTAGPAAILSGLFVFSIIVAAGWAKYC